MKPNHFLLKLICTALVFFLIIVQVQSQVWTSVSPLPGDVRDQAMAFSLFGKGYVCGGYNGTQILKDTWEYDPLLNAWTQMADMPQRNNGAATFTSGYFGYVVGGYNFTNNELNVLWRFNPQTNNWNSKADFIGPRDNGALSWRLNNKGYFGCGWNGINMTDDVWQYDPAADTWTQVSSFPGGPRASLISFAHNNIGFAGLGDYPSLNPLTDFYKYDPDSNIWTTCASFPGTPRFWAMSFVVNGCGYVGGGATTITHFLSDWWQYNIAKDKWTSICDFDGGRLALSKTFVIGNDAYMISGRDSTQSQTNLAWKFNPALLQLPVISTNNAGCAGDTTTLTVYGVNQVIWSTGDTSLSISFVPSVPSIYYASASNGTCVLTDSIFIGVNTPPSAPQIVGVNDTLFCVDSSTYFQWYINGIPVSANGNNYYITNILPGSYTVSIVDSNGCHAVSAPFVFTYLSEVPSSDNCLMAFASKQLLTIKICDSVIEGIYNLELYSANGKLILKHSASSSSNNMQVVLPEISSGLYFLKITDDRLSYNTKLIVTD